MGEVGESRVEWQYMAVGHDPALTEGSRREPGTLAEKHLDPGWSGHHW